MNNLISAASMTIYITIICAAVLVIIIVALLLVLLTKGDKSKENGGKSTQNKLLPLSDRFPSLVMLDREKRRMPAFDRTNLETFCDQFRNYAADNMALYYDIADIRKFVAGMAVSKIIILQGISGTGKTSLAYAFGEFIQNPSTVIPVQPMWKERTDLIGYYNEFTRKFNETTLLKQLYKASMSDEIFITLLDEMNIARVEYYFAEFLSLLELPDPKRRFLDVVSDKWANDPKLLNGGRIVVPDNMWFVGTANNDDSTFLISDKVYDRAMILNLDFKAEPFDPPETNNIRISAADFNNLVTDALNETEMSRRNERKLRELDAYLIKNFNLTFGNRIKKQIYTFVPIYLSCGGDELDALDDILTKKIFRKLEMQNSVYLKSLCEPLCLKLDELFGEGKMPNSKAFVRRLVAGL